MSRTPPGRRAAWAHVGWLAAGVLAIAAAAPSRADAADPVSASGVARGLITGSPVSPGSILSLVDEGLRLKQEHDLSGLLGLLGSGPLGGQGVPLSVLAVGGSAAKADIDRIAANARSILRTTQARSALQATSLTPEGVIGAATGIVFAEKAIAGIASSAAIAKRAERTDGGASMPKADRAWEARAMLVALGQAPGASFGWRNDATGASGAVAAQALPPAEDISLVGMAHADGNTSYTEADALAEVTDPHASLIRLPLVCRRIEREYRPAAGPARRSTEMACKDHIAGWFVFQ